MLNALLITLAVAFAPTRGAEATPFHDLHVTYGNAAVEGSSILVRLRFFQDDLELELGRRTGASVLSMSATAEVDRVFLAYLQDHFVLEVEGERLAPVILDRGADLLDREPVWWYTLHFEAAVEVERFTLRNTLLFGLFEDQRNVVKFVRFPDETQKTFSFERGEDTAAVDFGR